MRRAAIASLAALLALYLVVLIRTAWVSDDGYITFRTVDNFVNGYGPRWNVDERVQAYTHPLWMLLVAAGYAITREPYFTSIALGVICSMAAVALTLWRVAASPAQAILAGLAFVGAKSFVDFSTSGLENPLVHLLLVWFWIAWSRARTDRSAAPIVVASLLLVTRQDLVWLIGPSVLAILLSRERRPAWRDLVIASLPFVAWELFSLLYYGFPVPNTAYAKLSTGVPQAELIPHGLAYLMESLRSDPLTLATIAASTAVSIASRSWPMRAIGIGQILNLAYVAWVGGDFMSGRFLTPAFMMGVLCLASRPVALGRVTVVLAGAAVVALSFVPAVPNVSSGRRLEPVRIDEWGIADERSIYFQTTGLVRKFESFRPPVTPQADVARRMIEAGQRVATRDQVGFFGYAAGPTLHIVDTLGLGDPLMARLPAQPGWRIGHYSRALPDGYIDSLRSAENRLKDPALAAYYAKLALVTRGPLFSWARLRAIADLNVGDKIRP